MTQKIYILTISDTNGLICLFRAFWRHRTRRQTIHQYFSKSTDFVSPNVCMINVLTPYDLILHLYSGPRTLIILLIFLSTASLFETASRVVKQPSRLMTALSSTFRDLFF
ncbi:3202_t:CDS:2 [Entrophospora sp. SA101]|nr:3202_t:CDS:2 [Entrophospora sp. SA101]